MHYNTQPKTYSTRKVTEASTSIILQGTDGVVPWHLQSYQLMYIPPGILKTSKEESAMDQQVLSMASPNKKTNQCKNTTILKLYNAVLAELVLKMMTIYSNAKQGPPFYNAWNMNWKKKYKNELDANLFNILSYGISNYVKIKTHPFIQTWQYMKQKCWKREY